MFAALVPPARAVEDLDAFLEPRREAGPDLRWSSPEQLHLTLAFYAAVEDHRVDELLERLATAAARRTAFEACVAGGGAFPDPGRARVLWAGLRLAEPAAAELDRLAAGARAAAARAGVVVGGQRFRPHLTLARLARPQEVSRWVRLLDGYAGPPWTADRVVLVASHLGEGPRRRPRHEVVGELTLGGRDPAVS
jgi:2'-5' RNA ligase